MEEKADSIARTLKYISVYLNSPENVITNIFRIDYYNDYPFFYQYATEYLPRNGRYESDLLANGISKDKNVAFIKAVMETIERWYLSNYKESEFIFDSYKNLKNKFIDALNPNLLRVVSQRQLLLKNYSKFKFSDNSRFYWTKVHSIVSKKQVNIPAQLAHFMHNKRHNEPCIRISDSTGAAAGTSIEEALYKGVCEIIERDAYAIIYYNKLPARKIAKKAIPDIEIQFLINYIERHYFDVVIFDITLDIKVPIFLCILIDKTSIGPKIIVGVKCSLFWKEAIHGAIMEALQGLNSTRELFSIKNSLGEKNFNKITNSVKPIVERLLFWARPSSIAHMDFLLALPYQQPSLLQYKKYDESASFRKRLALVVQKLEETGIRDVYWKKITPLNLDKFSLYAAKVVIPELQPISLDNKYLYFGGKRLYTVPVKLGLRKSPIKERELNTIPHPLP